MEKGKFEGSVSDAFKNAEVGPSEDSWTNIALELEKANAVNLKKKLITYQLLAAASVVFAMGISLGMYLMNERNNELFQQLAIQREINSNQSRTNSNTNNKAETENGSDEQRQRITDFRTNKSEERDLASNTTQEKTINTGISNKMITANDEIPVDDGLHQTQTIAQDESVLLSYSNTNLPALYKLSKPQIISRNANQHVDPVALMMARLDDRAKQINEESDKEKKTLRNEKLWTSVGLAAGSFNSATSSGVSSNPRTFSTANTNVADKEASANGVAYSVGVSLGAKVSDRWVLQGGVNYLTQMSDYTVHDAVTSSDFTSFRPATISDVGKVNVSNESLPTEEKLVNTAPYTVNNSMKYVSVPLQAGYLLINRTFGIQLNAGIATDLFLQNTVSAEEGNMTKTTQESGEDSPYRAVNFSGLMGTELSYRFAKHYRVALNPGIRYPLNTIYKSDTGVDSTPITFDLGLRFRYIFN